MAAEVKAVLLTFAIFGVVACNALFTNTNPPRW